MSELLIKDGTIIDGTGAPRFRGDVLVAGGKIKGVGKHSGSAEKVIDAGGLIVAPGLVDPHTHLDGQMLWEPRGTSSAWNGVTTVLTGLCGFTLAPCRPEHRDYLVRMFCRVEDMPLEVLQICIPWSWTTFPEYMNALDQGLGINVAPMVGHSALRYYEMGPEAVERKATDDEIKGMRAELRKSIEAGAFGFTSSRSPTHVDWNWKPVPSRHAEPEELVALAEELRDLAATGMAIVPEGLLAGITEEDKEVVLQMSLVSGRPVQLSGFGQGGWELIEASAKKGATIWTVLNSQPRYGIWTFRESTIIYRSMPTWRSIMEKPADERVQSLASPDMRQVLRDEVDAELIMDPLKRVMTPIHWEGIAVYRAHRRENRSLEGLDIRQMAQQQGKHLADALLDLAAAEDFETEFHDQLDVESEYFNEAKAGEIRNAHAIPMNTDSGAHVTSDCKSGQGVYFLRHWVIDRSYMTLEEGVRKVTSLPAQYIGLADRGVIREGAAADIIVFNPAELDVLTKERAFDMAGGAKRWIQKSTGIQYVIVNGRPTFWDGREVGDLPGVVLRSSWYR